MVLLPVDVAAKQRGEGIIQTTFFGASLANAPSGWLKDGDKERREKLKPQTYLIREEDHHGCFRIHTHTKQTKTSKRQKSDADQRNTNKKKPHQFTCLVQKAVYRIQRTPTLPLSPPPQALHPSKTTVFPSFPFLLGLISPPSIKAKTGGRADNLAFYRPPFPTTPPFSSFSRYQNVPSLPFVPSGPSLPGLLSFCYDASPSLDPFDGRVGWGCSQGTKKPVPCP